jgi:hypothetical protein
LIYSLEVQQDLKNREAEIREALISVGADN